MIKISYHIKHSELARASLFFIEHKFVLKILVTIVNISAIIMLILATLKLFSYNQKSPENFSLNDAGIIFFATFWLTMRKNINEWLIKRRIAHNLTNDKTLITIEITENGLLAITNINANKPTSIAWKSIKTIFAIKNGFIIPVSSINFIWLPCHGFTSEQDLKTFSKLIEQQKIKIINAQWSC